MICKTRHVIAVRDLAVSAAFYRDVLGFTARPLAGTDWSWFTSGECTIMAGECPQERPATELGNHSYFAYLEVTDLDERYRRAKTADPDCILKEARDEPWGMREFAVRTVDGHRILFGQETGGQETG